MVVFLIFNNCLAQDIELTSAERQDLRAEAIQRVMTLQGYIEKIVDRNEDVKDRKSWALQATKLFTEDAVVEVSNSFDKPYIPVNEYFNERIIKEYDGKYTAVIMKYNYAAAQISSITRSRDAYGNRIYKALVNIEQAFCGKKNGCEKPNFQDCCYADVTEKKIEVIIKRVDNYTGVRWAVYLRNIYVAKTIIN